MRNLDRNKTNFYFAVYEGEGMLTDASGLYTGEQGITYSTPILARGNISPATGNARGERFGTDVNYDKVIALEGTGWGITENSVLWIDTDDTTMPYDYVVRRVAVSLNQTSLAISKVR
mgnify:CR=1 FL=1